MKSIWIILALSLAPVLRSAVPIDKDLERTHLDKYECAQSPSRRYIALSGIGLADVSPSFRMRMRILLVTLAPVQVRQILPWVHAPYVVTWTKNDVLVVCGRSDDDEKENPPYEISAYPVKPNGDFANRMPTPTEREAVVAAFEKKYGQRPRPVVDVDGSGGHDFTVYAKLPDAN